MNWSTTIRELADRGELHGERLLSEVLARETVYVPSGQLPTQYTGIPVADTAYPDWHTTPPNVPTPVRGDCL